MAMKMKQIQTLRLDDKPRIRKFLRSEISRLENDIDILEQILDLVYDFSIDVNDANSIRIDEYSKIKYLLTENLDDLFQINVEYGSGIVGSTDAFYNSFNMILEFIKSLRLSCLKSSLEI